MVFETIDSFFIAPYVFIYFSNFNVLYATLILITFAFVVDGVDTLIRLRAFNHNKKALSNFRDDCAIQMPSYRDLYFTFVLTAYRNPEELKQSINSLLSENIPRNDILVVDDYSNDQYQTAKAAAELGVKVIALSRNTKKAGAVNVALGMITTEYVVLMDSDSILAVGFERLMKALREMERLGLDAMSGRVLPCSSLSRPNCKLEKRSLLFELQSLEYDQAMRLGRGALYSVEKNEQVSNSYKLRYGDVTSISGAFGIFRTSMLKEISLKFKTYEESFYGEDLERTFKILCCGGKIGYSDDIIVLTSSPIDFKSHFRQRVIWSRGMFRCFFSRFGVGTCKRRLAGLNWIIQVSRDILSHPLKLFSIVFLLFQPYSFLSIVIFYVLLNALVVNQVNIGMKISIKNLILLPFYRLYVSLFPTTLGYLEAIVHLVKLYLIRSVHSSTQLQIVRTWNMIGEAVVV